MSSSTVRYESALYHSTSHSGKLLLGTIEKDASGGFGAFKNETVRGEKILAKLLETEAFDSVLDVGAGALKHTEIFLIAGKTVDTVDFGTSTYFRSGSSPARVRKSYVGDFNELEFDAKYDLVWCSHILEHQLNPNTFLKKIRNVVKEGGLVGIVVPPRKPFITDGHVSLWNAGLVVYHLVLAGFDCSEYLWIKQYDYNIGVVIRARSIPESKWPSDLCMDVGDLEKLSSFFPKQMKFGKGTNGDIFEYPVTHNKLKIAILIPARYDSSRFPGKPLQLLDGVPMVLRVLQRCLEAGFDTYILSDDERVLSLSSSAIKTSRACRNGTERCAEGAGVLSSYDAIINVQGDMPDITAEIIYAVAEQLENHSLISVYTDLTADERANPNSVKLIHNSRSAIWSCRAALPYGDHHLGVYGYHRSILMQYPSLPVCAEEEVEGLEQIRWFHSGFDMRVVKVNFSGKEINTPEDAASWTLCH